MGQTTEISWTDATFNPWWGCTKVSAGCAHCYADTLAHRYGMKIWGQDADRRFFGDKHWAEPEKWDRDARMAGVFRTVFCASMADVMEDRRDLDPQRVRLWALIRRTPSLRWLLLTKRPENYPRLLPADWLEKPQFNVWLGTTVEDQRAADTRIPHLLAVPAAVRFLSCEPLLGAVDILTPAMSATFGTGQTMRTLIHWVIVGGESGHGARPMHPAWARSLRDQCAAAGMAYHFKQHGEWYPAFADAGTPGGTLKQTFTFPDGQTMWRLGKSASGRILDGATWDQFPAEAK